MENNVDINKVENELNDQFNCEGVDFFNYKNYKFVKAFEKGKLPMKYRYFNISDKTNELKEVEDEEILDYFREKYEPTIDVIY